MPTPNTKTKEPSQLPKSRPFSVSQEEYPFRDHWFEKDGTSMHYLDEGEGLPVVMLHGNPTWSFLYRNIIKEMRNRCRCIAPDYPGFGFSEHPEGYGYSPREHAKWVSELIGQLQLNRYVLVLQDWGGPIGLSIAVDHPDKVAGLVICNTWCWAPSVRLRLFSHLMGGMPAKYLHLNYNFFARFMVPLGITKEEVRRDEILKAYTDAFPTRESRKGTWVFPRAIRKSAPWLRYLEQRLDRLQNKPVELVWAMKDPAFGKVSFINRWKRYFPEACVRRVPDASHFIQEDRPDEVVISIKRVLEKIENA